MEEYTNCLVHYGVKGMKWRNKRQKTLPPHSVTPIYDPNDISIKAVVDSSEKLSKNKRYRKYKKNQQKRIQAKVKRGPKAFKKRVNKSIRRRTAIPSKMAKGSVKLGKRIYYKHKMKKATKGFAKKMINNF